MTTEAFLDELAHARIDEIRRVRAAILSALPEVTESIKWNAPNFLVAGADRVTFRIQPGDVFQVILHRGAAKSTMEYRVDAPADLVRWAGPDRGILTVPVGDVDGWIATALPVIVAWARLA